MSAGCLTGTQDWSDRASWCLKPVKLQHSAALGQPRAEGAGFAVAHLCPSHCMLAHSSLIVHIPASERHSLLVCGQLPLGTLLQVSVSSFIFIRPWASETNWPFSCSSKLCSLSWECFCLQTQPIWVCLTAGMFSNSMGACLSLAFCLLQHSEIINK